MHTRFPRRAPLLGPVLLIALIATSSCTTGTPAGVARTYYVAADEVDWNYTPADSDLTMGRALPTEPFEITNVPGAVARVLHKAVYHEYTDSTFTTRAERPAKWAHLGILGPVLRGAVGDTIVVVFRNNTTFPASMHPHGVFYDKASEGSLYNDGSPDKMDDSVPPGGTHRYVWPIPERAGPGPDDPSSLVWTYHSHTHELQDVYSGLIGPIIVTARGKAKADGSPTDVDREFVTLFGSFNENNSHFTGQNLARYAGDSARSGPKGRRQFNPNQYHTINGLMYGNLPLASLTMHVGDRVRWYVMTSTGFDDFHSPHWHGATLLVHGERKDVLDLDGPLLMQTADMVTDDPGIWLLHCHFGEHMEEGMSARFQVLPAGRADTTPAR